MAKFSEKRKLHNRAGNLAKKLAEKLEMEKITGLPVSDALTVTRDLMDVYIKNLSYGEDFKKVNGKRVLFLPHCSRKNMDSKCQAEFDKEISAYRCSHCSRNCLINKATRMGEKKGYDVYVVPGGSCIPKILKKEKYGAIVGVACPEELKQGLKIVDETRIPSQAVPLLKNGCSDTYFNLDTLEEILDQ